MDQLSNLTLYATFFFALYFEVFMLVNFFEKRSSLKTEEARTLSVFPSITIIVPVFNEENTVTKTVFSLLKLDYPKDKLKIIIVDDGSTDRTPTVIKRFRSQRRVEIIRKSNGGKYTALNAGLAVTTTDLVGCLDADSFVPPDTLKKIIPYFENEKTMAVTPAIKIHRPDGFIRHVQSNEYNLGIFMKKCFSIIGAITVTPGPFSIFRKSVFDNLGLFREAHNTEDLEIAMRMQKNLYRITNAHTAVVYTTGPATLHQLYRQRVRWIQGFLSNTIDYRSVFFKREYGHLGLFALPAAIISIILFFVSIIMILRNVFNTIGNKIIEIQSVGLRWHWPKFEFDWFFLNTDSKVFLSIVLFSATIILIMYGRKISEKKTGLSIHTLYFPFVYAFLSIIWLSRAVYATAFSKETRWR
ncbi:MAG: Glycosyltransferase involved in cell wall biogenesis [Candidatus Kaiserbacteria bacterium GW2011_GWA2_49_19]|uniref:Glycosyltransferase involved in cell wall biogenesis n=1 Tax=Candidatus Kaiserbacteria bacterium GW2011_GWA2_49_19 TaxID=1618669 RepID=A0A0G1VT40_9BACT|nr:MAG: Glycosyltransferase involved in cell wall biogenesis [Candidatus Kaiserbacteria bacterium GW2011_GWA2_49_19]